MVARLLALVQGSVCFLIEKWGGRGGKTKRKNGLNNHPALQELFEDIKQRKIDIVLSYKIDRLTCFPKGF